MTVPRIPTGCAACMASSVESSVASTKPSPRTFKDERKVRMFSPVVSGDHCGFEFEEKPCLRSMNGFEPSVAMTNMRNAPPVRVLWNAIMFPSGDHAGAPSLAELVVRRVCEPPDEVIL